MIVVARKNGESAGTADSVKILIKNGKAPDTDTALKMLGKEIMPASFRRAMRRGNSPRQKDLVVYEPLKRERRKWIKEEYSEPVRTVEPSPVEGNIYRMLRFDSSKHVPGLKDYLGKHRGERLRFDYETLGSTRPKELTGVPLPVNDYWMRFESGGMIVFNDLASITITPMGPAQTSDFSSRRDSAGYRPSGPAQTFAPSRQAPVSYNGSLRRDLGTGLKAFLASHPAGTRYRGSYELGNGSFTRIDGQTVEVTDWGNRVFIDGQNVGGCYEITSLNITVDSGTRQPAPGTSRGYHREKFSFHLHAEELREFLSDKPCTIFDVEFESSDCSFSGRGSVEIKRQSLYCNDQFLDYLDEIKSITLKPVS